MPDFLTRLSDGMERALTHLELAAVPLVLALIGIDKVARILAFDGIHAGIRFGFPLGVIDLWQFVDVPAGGGVSVQTGSVVVLAVSVLLRSVLGAGYFGSIRGLLVDGEYDFVGAAGRYAASFLVLVGLPAVAILVLGVLAAGPGGVLLVLLAIPGYLVVGYLFYATPYLLVLRDTDLVSAATASYEMAVDGGPYFEYALGYFVFLVVVSGIATAVVVNLGILGVGVGILALSPLGLGLNVATMRFVADVDDHSPDVGTWPGDHLGGTPGEESTTADAGVEYGPDNDEERFRSADDRSREEDGSPNP